MSQEQHLQLSLGLRLRFFAAAFGAISCGVLTANPCTTQSDCSPGLYCDINHICSMCSEVEPCSSSQECDAFDIGRRRMSCDVQCEGHCQPVDSLVSSPSLCPNSCPGNYSGD